MYIFFFWWLEKKNFFLIMGFPFLCGKELADLCLFSKFHVFVFSQQQQKKTNRFGIGHVWSFVFFHTPIFHYIRKKTFKTKAD